MNETVKKITMDLYSVQMKWVAWYLPIVYVFYVAVFWIVDEPEIRSMSLLTFTFQTATIFLLICGILSSLAFLPMYVKHGVTRKSYFQGAFYSSIGLAITTIGITTILTWILSVMDINALTGGVLSSLGEGSWLWTTISYIIVVMVYFLSGWLVGLGFYRYGGAGGFVSIVVAFVIVSLNDLLWAFSTPKPMMGLVDFTIPVPHVAIAIVGSIVIAAISTILVYKIVRDIPIKIK
ncbi:hypothetical protein [Oceanobacillus senegalensis]|uniref:hypothetical protein n=1 Tax=Oceanobacillus senegalensis TaxID=1936063 RepID=UPI000A30B005|nr:hypothetical protein [Oceanobacillus senegalensis]